MMKKPFFSIIIPTLNVADHIVQALDSLQEQTCRDWECLIIDGLSKDSTIGLIKAHQSSAKIHIHCLEPKGVYSAMNYGIQKSIGSYLYFLGADDRLLDKNVLNEVKGHLEHQPIDVLYGNVDSPSLGKTYDGPFNAEKIFHKNIAHQAIFYKADIFKKIGLYNMRYPIHADWALNLKWFLDPAIDKIHLDRTIANFATGGLSSRTTDPAFRKDLIPMYYLNARKSLTKRTTIANIFKGLVARLTRNI